MLDPLGGDFLTHTVVVTILMILLINQLAKFRTV